MKIFNRSSFTLSVAITINLALVIFIYSYFESQGQFKVSEWLETLFITLFATSSAFLFGLSIYLQQLKDEKKRVRNFIATYLNFILSELDFDPETDTVSIKHISPTLIDNIILSGYVEDVALLLIKVQSQLRLYQQFREEAISFLNHPDNNNDGLPNSMKLRIDDLAEPIRDSVTICLREMST